MPTVQDLKTKGEVVLAIQRMLEALLREPNTDARATAAMVSRFNELLQQTKEHFRAADTLRLMDPVEFDASIATIVVRLSMVQRTVNADDETYSMEAAS